MEPPNPRHPTAPAGSDHELAVDAGILHELGNLQIDGEPDALPELIDLFLTDAEQRLATLRLDVQQANVVAAQRGAHALQGSCGIFGARAMVAICEQLERAVESPDGERAATLLTQLDAEYRRVRAALQEALPRASRLASEAP